MTVSPTATRAWMSRLAVDPCSSLQLVVAAARLVHVSWQRRSRRHVFSRHQRWQLEQRRAVAEFERRAALDSTFAWKSTAYMGAPVLLPCVHA